MTNSQINHVVLDLLKCQPKNKQQKLLSVLMAIRWVVATWWLTNPVHKRRNFPVAAVAAVISAKDNHAGNFLKTFRSCFERKVFFISDFKISDFRLKFSDNIFVIKI